VPEALVLEYLMCMSHIILTFLTCLIPPCFSTLSGYLSNSQTDVLKHKNFVSIFCTNLNNFSFQENFRKMSKVYVGVHEKMSVNIVCF
jgi:hypothetical protein